MTLWHDAAGCRHDTVGLPRMTPGSPINVSKCDGVTHVAADMCQLAHDTTRAGQGRSSIGKVLSGRTACLYAAATRVATTQSPKT